MTDTLIEKLQFSLRQAIFHTKQHNAEYHHETKAETIKEWERLVAERPREIPVIDGTRLYDLIRKEVEHQPGADETAESIRALVWPYLKRESGGQYRKAGKALEQFWKDNQCTGDWGAASFWFMKGWELCGANNMIDCDLLSRIDTALLDVKMSATNALAEAWVTQPKPAPEAVYPMLIESLKIIQARALRCLAEVRSQENTT